MKQFNGFPARMEFIPVPAPFFALLPEITDPDELKVTLFAIALRYRKKGSLRYVAFSEFLADKSLADSLGEQTEKRLQAALDMATARGTLLQVATTDDNIYFLNTPADRTAVSRIQSGELALPDIKIAHAPPAVPVEKLPDIFSLYEQNIGLLTPMIADELKEAEKTYPQEWLREAFKEAVDLNKRSWRYIQAILERWSAEGKSSGAHQRHPEKAEDPDKYVKGKYGHMVRR